MAIRGFASDNNAGIHPKVLEAIISANQGHRIGYGNDEITANVREEFKKLFGTVDVYLVFTGTAANVLGLSSLLQPYNAVICAETSHLHADECGAPERFGNLKLLTVPTVDGKLTVEKIKTQMHGIGDEHHIQPKAISITQATEYGTVYSVNELAAISSYAHQNNLIVHVDGARIANAAAYLGWKNLRLAFQAGCVDVLSFGGTKNGVMGGEAVIFFSKYPNFKFIRKQGMQLASKMRFISAQFQALLRDDLWLKNAKHSNEMAALLALGISELPAVRLTQKVETNTVF
ncbi:MAG: threonine aldolase, partial [Bacteroidetes bacterium RIFCSPHIGHO2_02_FULL_44_7]